MAAAPDKSTLIVLPQVDSTNTYAKNHFFELEDCTVVAAVEQTAGRGRLGRKWVTAPNTALTATVVFKEIQQPFHAGAIAGLAGLELIREKVSRIWVMAGKWDEEEGNENNFTRNQRSRTADQSEDRAVDGQKIPQNGRIRIKASLGSQASPHRRHADVSDGRGGRQSA